MFHSVHVWIYKLFSNFQGLKFKIEVSNFAEDLKEENFSHPRDYVVATAVVKAQEVL